MTIGRTAVVAIAVIVGLLALSLVSPAGAPLVDLPRAAHAGPMPMLRPSTMSGPRTSGTDVPAAAPVPSVGPSASGRGTFFRTSDLGFVPATQRSCFTGTCVNVSTDPSLNLTSRGLLAVAYTAYTNASPCPGLDPFAVSEIGFRSSPNGGLNWSPATILGNPDCASGSGREYPSAWEPSLTSLGNGTLVLVYVEYNVSTALFAALPQAEFGPTTWNVNYDRLVVTRSYDNGSRWTLPAPLNTSANPGLTNTAYAPQRPWVTATGKTVYVAWMNWTENFGTVFNFTSYTYVPVGFASAAVHLAVSTDGGSSFGSAVTLASTPTLWGDYAMNPFALVEPSGELLVTYATNLTFHPLYDCSNGCFTSVWTVDVMLASSIDNGSSFTYVNAEPNMAVPVLVDGPFSDPSPQLAYSSATGELFLAFTAMRFHPWCYPSYGCGPYEDPAVVFVTNSSTDGTSWAPLSVPAVADLQEFPTTSGVYLLPAIGVNATGTLDLAMTFVDGTQCQPGPPYACRQYEAFQTSSDNGATFTDPIFVTGNNSVFPFIGSGTAFGTSPPLGEYATMVTSGSASWFGWTNPVCPAGLPAGACDYPSALGGSGVEVSQPFMGVGTNLTFHPVGLPVGGSWQVNVLGNVRRGSSDLVFSGVPIGDEVSWAPVPNVSVAYGVRAAPSSIAPASPTIVAANATIAVTFSTQFLLNVEAIPPFTPPPGGVGNYCYSGPIVWDNPSCLTATLNITPQPGSNWEAPNTVVPLNVTNATMYCAPTATCGSTDYANVTFLSWSGAGNGSYSGLSRSADVTMLGPLNETASFQVNGWCYYSFAPPGPALCVPNTESILFQETGLPHGTNWTVTIRNANDSSTNSSSTGTIVATGPFTAGVAAFSVWSIPAPGGKYWVPTASPISPVVLPEGSVVQVTFVLKSIAGTGFPVELVAQGLPPGTNWSYSLDGAWGGVQGGQANLTLLGGNHNITAPTVVLSNESAYVLSSLQVQEFVQNRSAQNFSQFPATWSISGPSIVLLNFSLAYLLTVDASAGGTATPASRWVVPGQSVTLVATANSGYYFVGWTGTGPGAFNSRATQITVSPNGPARELATFARIPAPTWTVTVTATGLPATVVFAITLGSHSYTGTGSFTVSSLSNGSYALAVPYAYLNASTLTRFVPTLVTPTFARSGDQLTIDGNGTISIAFTAESVVSLSANTGGNAGWAAVSTPAVGNASGGIGPAWVEGGTAVTWTATPSAGYRFVGWSGLGAGSFNSTALAGSATVDGPVQESAEFEAIPAAVSLGFALTLVPSGLAPGALWNASIGSTGGTSVGGSIVIAGLNGSYTVTIPTVFTAPGIRYVNATGSFPVTVRSASTVTVAFTEQVLLTVTASAGGTTGPATEWVAVGTTVSLSATPNASSSFASWNGTGPGAYSGATVTVPITVTAPVDEVAHFAALPAPAATPTTSSNANGLPISLGLLAALLVVGLVVGLLVGRRRGPPPEISGPADVSTEASAPFGEEPSAPAENSSDVYTEQ